MLKYRWIGTVLFFCILFFGCGNKLNKRISIGLVSGWAEGEAMTLVAQQYMTSKGYNVVLQKATPDLLLASMNNGDTDAYLDVWLPKTHGSKVARFDKIQSAGIIYNGARTGLVVPSYVQINSIEELNAHREQFDGRIIGIERGSGAASMTDQVIKDYKLDFQQLNSSTVAMISELQKAIREKRWVVVTGWKPHWMFSRFDLKFLDDSKLVYGDAERIETYVRNDLNKDFPEVYQFLQRMNFDDNTLADLLDKLEKSKNKKETVKQWVAQHQALISHWWAN